MIAIRAADQDGLLLAAALTGERRALTDLALLRALATHPLLTVKVVGATIGMRSGFCSKD